jgi:thioester reductase-like protein
MNTIIDYLEHWAAIQPGKCFSSFLDVQGKEVETYTYSDFHERSRHLAEYLSRQVGLKRGERALLVYPPGLEVIVAFVACARIGVIPAPVLPPTPVNFERGLAKLTFVARDCDARVALTTRSLYRSYRTFLEKPQNSSLLQIAPTVSNLDWVTTDDVRGQASDAFDNDPGPVLFLQYTSGSTGDPKGVIVSHENVIHNCRATTDHIPTAVCWLPQYHDMGLIGYYVYLVITGGTTYGFSPMDFLKRPALWLQTLSRVQATYTSSPNFGFEYCLREDKIPSDQLSDLDLSSVRVLMNGSEPVRAETYCRFLERFSPYGLRPEAHVVAYGLAENTLAATNYGRRMVTVNKHLLQKGTLHIENAKKANNDGLRLVSCGRPLDGIHVRIVDPKSNAALGSGQIGEIWLAGKSKCQGYWNRPELTYEVFYNAVANDPEDHNAYLRSGDLGFLDDGELFVCGRIKDLIIVRGVNYYPQDIENIVESTSQKIRTGGVVAFSGDEDEDLVVVVGVRRAKDLPDPAKISHALRTHYYTGPHKIVFATPRAIVKTTSGKIARSLIRQRWLNGELPVIATHVIGQDNVFMEALPSGLRARFHTILKSYSLTGRETYSLAEAGIDSLTMALLIHEIEQLLEEHGITKLVNVIDGQLLQRLTVAELFSLLNQLEEGSEEPIAALQFVLKQIKQENDEREADCMRQDAKLGAVNCANASENDEPLTSVLLTGPTGFFGPFLLSSLLLKTPYNYYVLIRAPDGDSGMARIRHSLRSAGLWAPALDEDLEKRVHVVCGDIAQKNLGMGSELWKSLATRVQAVIHNAALVNYVLNYDALKPHNVDGTRELLRFSCTGTKKEFHFISSTIIFGWTENAELLETDNNEEMMNLDFGYAQSKWVGEQLVFAAEKQGLKVRVYRPSFISASTGGIASREDVVIRLLAFMINQGIAPNAWNQISLLPADITANNIASIFKQRQIEERTFHVTADDSYNLTDITRLIRCEYGYPFTYYDTPTFVAEMKRLCAKDDPLYPFLDFFSRSHLKIAAMEHKRYNNSRYREARRLSGNGCDDPSLKETVSYLMAYMLEEGIIPRARVSNTVQEGHDQ